jgi:plasmid maintenance system antidote protein VapI
MYIPATSNYMSPAHLGEILRKPVVSYFGSDLMTWMNVQPAYESMVAGLELAKKMAENRLHYDQLLSSRVSENCVSSDLLINHVGK